MIRIIKFERRRYNGHIKITIFIIIIIININININIYIVIIILKCRQCTAGREWYTSVGKRQSHQPSPYKENREKDWMYNNSQAVRDVMSMATCSPATASTLWRPVTWGMSPKTVLVITTARPPLECSVFRDGFEALWSRLRFRAKK